MHTLEVCQYHFFFSKFLRRDFEWGFQMHHQEHISIRGSVCRSVGPSFRPSIRYACAKNKFSCCFWPRRDPILKNISCFDPLPSPYRVYITNVDVSNLFNHIRYMIKQRDFHVASSKNCDRRKIFWLSPATGFSPIIIMFISNIAHLAQSLRLCKPICFERVCPLLVILLF